MDAFLEELALDDTYVPVAHYERFPIEELEKVDVSEKTKGSLRKAMMPSYKDRYQSVSLFMKNLIKSVADDNVSTHNNDVLNEVTVVDTSSHKGATTIPKQTQTKINTSKTGYTYLIPDKTAEIWIEY